MSENCIFCKIINKEIPSVIVYEDDNFVAILDKFPTAKAHVLVIPKIHEENIFTASDITTKNILFVAKKICLALNNMGYNNINLLQNNGEIAGQTINHFHLHLVPREENDKVTIEFNSEMEDDDKLAEIKDEIVKCMI